MSSRNLLKFAAAVGNSVHLQCDSRTLVSQSRRCLTTVLNNKVALVTGSRRGIGLGIAEALAKRGCNVVLNGTTDDELAAAAKTRLSRHGVKVDYISADLAKEEDVDRLCQGVLGLYPTGADILINNAGFQYVSPVDEFPQEKWNAMIAVMLTAPFHLTRVLLPYMKEKRWGRIINVSSVHGLKASPNKSAYITAKHGLVGLTKTVALEAARYGVTCMAICPGYVETDLFTSQIAVLAEKDGISESEEKTKFLSNIHPSGESVGIEQVAEAALFLCSNAASQMTGSSLVLDGGWTAK